jgi:deazaflavin-dependent oxidoreductase (nitroreductase family)
MYRYEQANLARRIFRRSGAWPGMWWAYARALHHVDGVVYRATRQRATFTSWVTGLPVVQLTTKGARSGRPRTLPLVAIPHDDGLIVIASNFGQQRNPAWYHNLRANPRASARFEGETRELVARELEGEERDRWYERGIEIYPGWVQYRTRTAAHRKIPVIELMPAG